jgi:hypothetical protein
MPSTKRRTRSIIRKSPRKTLRKTKSLEPQKNISTEKIGEGVFGIVSRPPSKCHTFFSKK